MKATLVTNNVAVKDHNNKTTSHTFATLTLQLTSHAAIKITKRVETQLPSAREYYKII